MSVQVRQGGAWGPWYALGTWGADKASVPDQEDERAKVEVDTLELKSPADALRWRVVLEGGGKPPVLSLFAVSYDDKGGFAASTRPYAEGPWTRELDVPARSQRIEEKSYSGDICSPTSLSMAAAFWGVSRPTRDWVADVYDSGSKIYGNWPFNVAAAAERGLSGYVTRLASIEELQDEIAAGRPAVASLTFKEGELNGAPMRHTRGHLVVVRGFTKDGDVVVNDPGAPPDSIRRVYKRKEFERAWLLNKRGVIYRLLGKPPPVPF